MLAACGGPAIQDASEHIAGGRGCDAAELTIAAIDGAYHVVGCGEPAVYRCTDGECTAADGPVDDAWVSAATGAMSAIEADVLECNEGEPVTIQVLIEPDGRVNGLASHPEITEDARLCIGRVVYDNVTLEAGDHHRLVAYAFGGGGSSGGGSVDEAALPVDPDPMEEPTEEPVEEPVDEPVDADSEGDVEAEPLEDAGEDEPAE